MLMGRLAGAFAGWRSSTSQLAHERRLAHTSVARLRLRSAAAAFSAWRVHVPYSRGKRDMLREALSAMTERGQRAAWRAWREAFSSMRWYAQYSRGKKAMLGSTLKRFSQRLLAAAFAGMREECSQKRQLRVMAMQAVAYWKGSATVAAFSAWSDWTTERLQTKRKVLNSLATVNETRLRQSLQEWQSAARWRVKMKGICRKMIARMQHRNLMMCLGYKAADAQADLEGLAGLAE
ncbi:g5072 [Coccomyxa viridis]|uniref:G5072 protein n=1 Tax=Coccomyxa viridis TaxID=1274662 RepID=A0ABP1FWV1_9CHLO